MVYGARAVWALDILLVGFRVSRYPPFLQASLCKTESVQTLNPKPSRPESFCPSEECLQLFTRRKRRAELVRTVGRSAFREILQNVGDQKPYDVDQQTRVLCMPSRQAS